MKNIYYKILIGTIASFLVIACNNDKEAIDAGNNNLAPSSIGYSSKGTVHLDGVKLNSAPYIDVVDKKNDVLTVDVFVPIPEDKSSLMDSMVGKFGIFKRKYIDDNGNFKTRMRFANNESGLSYINSLGMKRSLVKYDAEVGAEWSFSSLSGKKITSKVIYKSQKEDFPYGLSKIKITKTEVNSMVKGITKFVYIANEDLGLVGIDVYLEDGTVLDVRKD